MKRLESSRAMHIREHRPCGSVLAKARDAGHFPGARRLAPGYERSPLRGYDQGPCGQRFEDSALAGPTGECIWLSPTSVVP